MHRRHLTSGQKVALAAEIKPMLAEEAKGRQKAAGERGKEGGRGKKKTLQEKVPEGNPAPQARDQAAKLTCTNGRYVSDAEAVKEKAPVCCSERILIMASLQRVHWSYQQPVTPFRGDHDEVLHPGPPILLRHRPPRQDPLR